jgi:hypothetical protein
MGLTIRKKELSIRYERPYGSVITNWNTYCTPLSVTVSAKMEMESTQYGC